MSNVIHDTVLHGSSCVNLARVADYEDELPLAVDSITYSIKQEVGQDVFEAVAGHTDEPVSIVDCLFTDLQTDSRWTADATGYNFRHLVPIDEADSFPVPGIYWVRYRFEPAAGQPFVIAFRLRAL